MSLRGHSRHFGSGLLVLALPLFPESDHFVAGQRNVALCHYRPKCAATILRQVLPNFRKQLARAEGLWHVVIASGVACLLFVAAQRI
jgi:hypothetical protein